MIERGWKYYPALKLAVPFAAGIAIAHSAALPMEWLVGALAIALLWLTLALLIDARHVAPPLLLLLLSAGALRQGVLHDPTSIPETEPLEVRDAELIGRVVEEPVVRGDRLDLMVSPDSILYRNSVARVATHVLVRIYDSTIGASAIPGEGDRISIVGTLAIPRPPVNPGELDYGAFLRSRGIELTLSATGMQGIHIFARRDLTVREMLVLPAREAARTFARDYVGGEEGDIVRALLIGEREYIDAETRDAFTRTGTVHILAVSGLHIGVIALALFVVVSWIPGRWLQFTIYSSALLFYLEIAGGGAPIARAVIMAIAFMLARLVGRISRPLNTLGFAALCILVVDPAQLFDVGFQLSFAAVGGILACYGPAYRAIMQRAPKLEALMIPRAIVQMLLLSLSAQLFTLPLVLHHFGYISPITPLVDIAVVPLTSIALGAGLAGAVVMNITPFLAEWFGACASLTVGMAVWCVQAAAQLGAGVEIVPIGMLGAATMIGAALHLVRSRSPRQYLWRAVSVVAVAVSVIVTERMLDPLRRRDAGYLYLLAGHHGASAAVADGDTLTIYAAGRSARDTASIRRSGEGLRRRIGAGAVRIVDLDVPSMEERNDVMIVNDAPRELALRTLPALLSSTAARPMALVRAGRDTLLQVPLNRSLDRALALRHSEEWEVVEWR